MSALYAHKRKVSSFFLNFFFRGVEALGWRRVGVGAWVEALGCGWAGVGARVRGAWVGMGAGWMERAEDEAGWIKMGAGGLPGARLPGRQIQIRIAGSCVIDRPTFRIPGSHICAWDVGLFPTAAEVTPHRHKDGVNASRRS